jgi:hypothetical protein
MAVGTSRGGGKQMGTFEEEPGLVSIKRDMQHKEANR